MAAPKWILIADDDDDVREVLREALISAGYRVLTARNGSQVLDLMRGVVPDLIILDFRMPEGSGPAVLAVLQGSPLFQEVPVLIVSGYLEDEPPRASLGLNIIGRLPKPTRLDKLLGVVQAALAARPA